MTYPFFSDWDKNLTLPDFKAIKADMFLPAFKEAMAAHRAEVEAILNNSAPPTFENTLVPLELAGRNLDRVNDIFGIMTGTRSTKKLQKIDEKISPELSRHSTEIAQLPKLFERIDAIYQGRDKLEPEARRLVEEKHRELVLSGAKLPPEQKKRLVDIGAKLAELHTKFGNRLMNEVDGNPLFIESAAALDGVDADVITAMAEAAKKTGKSGHLIKMQRDGVEVILKQCKVRATRQKIHEAFVSRCDHGDANDTKELIPQILKLRQEEAALLGFSTYSHLATVANMAKTPEAAIGLMRDLWEPAKAAMAREQKELEAAAAAEGLNEALQPWDWIYYAEKVRQQKYALDEAELKPYFSLNNVRKAAFKTAEKLFGIQLKARKLKGWHAEVKAFDVIDKASGKPIALFLTDYFARDGKQSGAWMSELAHQYKIDGGQCPIVYNVCNYVKPAKGQPALLSLDSANTLFHEFGHALHGMLSQATYPSLAGTYVYRDFVELPSQLYEHWLTEPKVMKQHLKHVETGEPIPDALIEKIRKAAQFNEGFNTVRFLSSALMDLELHQLPQAPTDISVAEKDILARYGMPKLAQMMHRPVHHSHQFASGYYASNYYVYMWAAVLDNDVFSAFEEKANPYHKPTARKLREHIYSAGNTKHPMDLFKAFRGREPKRDALLRHKGFVSGDKAA
jgi:peptidyl-dipeptidase Dcp